MSVSPDGLDRVAAHVHDAQKLKSRRGQRLVWAFVKIAHHVHLAFATSARTMAAEPLQRNKAFAAIVPLDGEFFADRLNF